MQVQGILETCLCVTDLDAAEEFYSRVLGLKRYSREPGRHVFFRCGRAMFLLFHADATRIIDGRVPPHGTIGAGHVAFSATERDLVRWQAHLAAEGVRLETILDWPGGGRSLYFRDPSGNSVEIATPRIWGLTGESPRAKRPPPKKKKPRLAARKTGSKSSRRSLRRS